MNNRIFISGPVTGVPDYKDNFDNARFILEDARRECTKHRHCISTQCPYYCRNYIFGCTIHDLFPDYPEIVSPVKLNPETRPWLLCMFVCIHHLIRCSYVFMLRNWQQSRGARIEHRIARLLNKRIIYQKS